jgi:hypothetical protein
LGESFPGSHGKSDEARLDSDSEGEYTEKKLKKLIES